MKYLVLAAVLAGCGPVAGELPRAQHEIDRPVTSSCSKPLYCGAIGYVDCESRADRPAYYFDRKTGKIIRVRRLLHGRP